jgi:hypothetical protein
MSSKLEPQSVDLVLVCSAFISMSFKNNEFW